MPRAAASTRAQDHVTLQFGLITVPVSVYGGTDSKAGISRKQFVTVTNDEGTTEDHPVGSRTYDKVTDQNVDFGDVQRKIETDLGYVFVEDDEIEKLFNVTPKSLLITTFQPLALWHSGAYVAKSISYLEASKVAGKGKTKIDNPLGQQALGLLLGGMADEGVFALVEFTSRGVAKPGALMPDGTLYLLFHDNELRERRPMAEVDLPDAVKAQAKMLIQSSLSTDVVDLTDKRSELILAFAEEKAAAGDFGKPVDTFVEAAPQQSDANALMSLLQASIDAAQAS